MDNILSDYISRHEHDECVRRLEEQDSRQDARLKSLENTVEKIGALTVSVEKLALSMEGMVKELNAQGNRLETLEKQDGEKWREFVKYLFTGILGAALGFLGNMLFGGAFQ